MPSGAHFARLWSSRAQRRHHWGEVKVGAAAEGGGVRDPSDFPRQTCSGCSLQERSPDMLGPDWATRHRDVPVTPRWGTGWTPSALNEIRRSITEIVAPHLGALHSGRIDTPSLAWS